MSFQVENDQELRKQIESTLELQRQRKKNILAEETAAEEAIVQLKEMVEILESQKMHLLEQTDEEFRTESNLQRTRYDLGIRRLDSCEKQISQI